MIPVAGPPGFNVEPELLVELPVELELPEGLLADAELLEELAEEELLDAGLDEAALLEEPSEELPGLDEELLPELDAAELAGCSLLAGASGFEAAALPASRSAILICFPATSASPA